MLIGNYQNYKLQYETKVVGWNQCEFASSLRYMDKSINLVTIRW